MRLTLQTDHALRILMALAGRRDETVSVDNLATQFGVSKNHLMKTAQALVAKGFVASVRGRSGGIRLARPAGKINIGDVPDCRLRGLLGSARMNFLATLNGQTLSQIINEQSA